MSDKKDDLIFEIDGNQITCTRPDFTNLMEMPCGFGDNEEQAFNDLLRQEREREKE